MQHLAAGVALSDTNIFLKKLKKSQG